MKITCYGASGEVTGSCYYVETSRARFIVDFGLHQGGVSAELKNRHRPPIPFEGLDAALITHAHIDHIGRLPLLAGTKFQAPIWATSPTVDLMPLMLRDSAHVQEQDAERWTRRHQRQGKPAVTPLYGEAEVEKVLPFIRAVNYNEPREVAPGVTARWVDAGHILGSASIELTVEDGPAKRTVVFSGDIGVKGAALLHDPTRFTHADLVFMESTYGDRDHRSLEATIEEFASIVREAVWTKEKVLIPAFAIGRSQQLLYYLAELAGSQRVPKFPVFLDSPMAISALEIYKRHQGILDGETQKHIDSGVAGEFLSRINLTAARNESIAINAHEGAGVIIAASGMCTGGRILHHLRHNVWRRDVRVVITGFQSAGTIGRQLVDGARYIRITGEPTIVRAKVHTLGGFSAHAGQSELVGWAKSFVDAGSRPRVVLTHGEDGARATLARKLGELGLTSELPAWGTAIEL